MTDPGPIITVEAPIAAEPLAAPADPVLRVLAGIGGVTILALGALVSLGAALVGALGVWFASLIAKRRRLPLSRLMSWVGAIAATAIALLIAGGVVFAKLPEGAIDEFRATIDSVQAAQASPSGATREQADSARQQNPGAQTGMVIGGLIGGYIVLMMLSALYGSIGWVGALLLVFAFRGAWLGGPAQRRIEIDA